MSKLMCELLLPFPDRELSPNNHAAWQVKESARQTAKDTGFVLARAFYEPFAPGDDYHARLTFCPPDKTRRDLDNLLASCKPLMDGICGGLQIDDSQIKRITVEWGEVVPGGSVLFSITKIEREEVLA